MHTVDVRDEPAAGVWRSNPCGVLYELAKRDPGQTAELLFGDDSILVFQDARAAVHLLRTRPERYDKNLGAFDAFFGTSRLTSDGKRWRALQKLSQPFISATDQAKVARAANHFFTAASQQLLSSRDARGESSVDAALSRAAASVISQVTLGFDMDEMSETCLDDFREILRYASLVTWNLPGSFPAEDEERRQAALSARERLRAGLSGMIEKRLKLAPPSGDLLTVLALEKDGEVDALGEVCTLLFAGFDTTAASLGWALFLLSTMPDLQDRLRAEVLAACGQRELRLEDIESLGNLVSFQNEALRIFPPIPMLSRIANQDDLINGIHVKQGQRVLLSIIGLHHDSHFFTEPARVVLARFPVGKVDPNYLGRFLPFGAGRRVCGGARIANVEVTTALAAFLRTIRVGFVETGPLLFDWQASMHRLGGHRFRIEAA